MYSGWDNIGTEQLHVFHFKPKTMSWSEITLGLEVIGALLGLIVFLAWMTMRTR